MKGKILIFDETTSTGKISGFDGNSYNFTKSDWKSNGAQIIAREVSEPFENLKTESNKNVFEELKQFSKQVNTYEVIKSLINFADNNNVFARFYKKSIMITPSNNRTRMLFTIWAKPSKNKLKSYFSPKAISEFYQIDEQEVLDQGFTEGYLEVDVDKLSNYITKLENLFKTIKQKEIDENDE